MFSDSTEKSQRDNLLSSEDTATTDAENGLKAMEVIGPVCQSINDIQYLSFRKSHIFKTPSSPPDANKYVLYVFHESTFTSFE